MSLDCGISKHHRERYVRFFFYAACRSGCLCWKSFRAFYFGCVCVRYFLGGDCVSFGGSVPRKSRTPGLSCGERAATTTSLGERTRAASQMRPLPSLSATRQLTKNQEIDACNSFPLSANGTAVLLLRADSIFVVSSYCRDLFIFCFRVPRGHCTGSMRGRLG